MSDDIHKMTAKDLSDLLIKREISALEVSRATLERLKAFDPKINAFISQTPDLAEEAAKDMDRRRKGGEKLSLLAGVPIGVKDVISVEGTRTTAGSKFLRNYTAIYDSTVTRRIKEAGMVIVGKTNCDEFAMGSSNENSAYGPVKNPWNLDRVPGGSSGGSAACVAAREVPLSLGTDTGGSIRQPAALCGIVGLKPTYGRVSRYGVVAFASSLDQVGPMARTTTDAAMLFDAISGHDAKDSTTSKQESPSCVAELGKEISGKVIGVPKEFLPQGLDAEVRSNFEASLKVIEKLGAKIEEISLPHTDAGIACYYIIAPAEASANLARYDGVRYTRRSQDSQTLEDLYTNSRTEGFGDEVRRRILLGTFVLSSGYYDAYYRKGQEVRTLIRRDFQDAFSSVDLIVTPTTPSAAFPLGSKAANPMEMYLSDVFTVTIALAGLPSLVVPSGFTKENLPLGLQLIGKPFAEAQLFSAGFAFESETAHYKKEPAP